MIGKASTKLVSVLTEVTKPLHQQTYDLLLSTRTQLEKLATASTQLNQQYDKLLSDKKKVDSQLVELQNKIAAKNNPIDTYLLARYNPSRIPAYKNKREYTLYLNELITPESFEVREFCKDYMKSDLLESAYGVSNKLAKNTRWVDEGKLYESGDYYLFPRETLTIKRNKTDCEDVAFAFASMFWEHCGVVYGFYTSGKEIYGHAYPVLLYKDRLFIVETTGTVAQIVAFDDVRYDSYFIVTKNSRYVIKTGVEFGVIAGWI